MGKLFSGTPDQLFSEPRSFYRIGRLNSMNSGTRYSFTTRIHTRTDLR